jgi:hypothetical protein
MDKVQKPSNPEYIYLGYTDTSRYFEMKMLELCLKVGHNHVFPNPFQ